MGFKQLPPNSADIAAASVMRGRTPEVVLAGWGEQPATAAPCHLLGQKVTRPTAVPEGVPRLEPAGRLRRGIGEKAVLDPMPQRVVDDTQVRRVGADVGLRRSIAPHSRAAVGVLAGGTAPPD